MSNQSRIKDELRKQSCLTALKYALDKVASAAYGIDQLEDKIMREDMRALHQRLSNAIHDMNDVA